MAPAPIDSQLLTEELAAAAEGQVWRGEAAAAMADRVGMCDERGCDRRAGSDLEACFRIGNEASN